MAKLIWLSDLHFTAEGQVLGHDPRQRLTLAVDHINTHHADAQYCVISGDLVNRGTRHDYLAVKTQLDRLQMPWLPMVGNHDDRRLVAEHLPVPAGGMADFVQYAVKMPGGLVICLDTLDAGQDAGAFCDVRLSWLRQVLEANAGEPTYVFMHHPPMPLGLPMQDQDRLKDGAELLDLLCEYPDVKHLFAGHVHRPFCGLVRGLPFATMRSVLYQAPAPWPAWDWDSFAPAREAPQMGVISLEDGGVQLHYDQFCEYGAGVE